MGIVMTEGDAGLRDYKTRHYKTLRGAKCALTRLCKQYNTGPEYYGKMHREAYIAIDGVVELSCRNNGYNRYVIVTP